MNFFDELEKETADNKPIHDQDNFYDSLNSQTDPGLVISKPLDSIAVDLLSNSLKQLPRNSPFRKEVISVIRPAYGTNAIAAARLGMKENLIQRSSHVSLPETNLMSIKKQPNIHHYHPTVTVQLSLAKNALDDFVPFNSAHRRKFSCSLKSLYSRVVSQSKNLLPTVQPLSKKYFYKLVHEMKLSHQKTIQQCSYCNDLKEKSTLSSSRLAICLVHDYVREIQEEAYFFDKYQVQEGVFGKRIYGEVFSGSLLVTDYAVMKPSSSRHEDLIIHEYYRDESGILSSRGSSSLWSNESKVRIIIKCNQEFFG